MGAMEGYTCRPMGTTSNVFVVLPLWVFLFDLVAKQTCLRSPAAHEENDLEYRIIVMLIFLQRCLLFSSAKYQIKNKSNASCSCSLLALVAHAYWVCSMIYFFNFINHLKFIPWSSQSMLVYTIIFYWSSLHLLLSKDTHWIVACMGIYIAYPCTCM